MPHPRPHLGLARSPLPGPPLPEPLCLCAHFDTIPDEDITPYLRPGPLPQTWLLYAWVCLSIVPGTP